MWVSTRAQYGMRALVEIAISGDAPVSLKVISEKQDISQHYLEQLVSILRRAGIVESVRGAYGGYRLARPMTEVTALEIVELMEGSLAPVTCIDNEDNCDRVGHCATEPLWRRVDEAVRSVLSSTTLADLVLEKSQLVQLEALPDKFTLAN